ELVIQGNTSAGQIVFRVTEFIKEEPLAQIEYVQLVDTETLSSIAEIENEALLALAVRIGKTRLIDNTVLRIVSN
ncbi:MAG TPA: pantoate--beta-alanine ligase, partial [Armatimonadota bacterium]